MAIWLICYTSLLVAVSDKSTMTKDFKAPTLSTSPPFPSSLLAFPCLASPYLCFVSSLLLFSSFYGFGSTFHLCQDNFGSSSYPLKSQISPLVLPSQILWLYSVSLHLTSVLTTDSIMEFSGLQSL